MMTVRTTSDPAEILGRIEPVLMADPVRNTIFATVRAHLRRTGREAQDARAAWCAYNSVALAARSSTVHPVAITDGWADLPALAAAIGELPSVAGLGGPAAAVDALVELMARAPTHRIAERLYRLDTLVAPTAVPGSARLATGEDAEIVAAWVEPFTLETHGALPDDFDADTWAEAAVVESRTWLWEDPDGVAVSMAARRPPAAGVARIGPVYTPPECRARGYGSAVTARATRDILDQGAVPVLYADRANPTSNRVYQRLGFRPVADRSSVRF
jgi:predicted GNAT family acetyltransferase